MRLFPHEKINAYAVETLGPIDECLRARTNERSMRESETDFSTIG